MYLPPYVCRCMQALEQAGFESYAVGGCVRDALLGITPHDYDLCTNALPEEMRRIFAAYPLVLSGEKHGTVGVVTDHTVVEITTFRTEGGYQDSRHPDWVRFVRNVEEDLARRDFTVNAMAYSPRTGFVDPCGGRADLENRILRAVGDPATRLSEDALRILRGIRFALRFRLTPDPETLNAMFRLAPKLDQIARERVFDELCKLLLLATADDLLRFAPILTQVIPELSPCVGFQQHNPHHAYDVFSHIAHVVEATPPELPLRWAALLHDAGKPGCYILGTDGRGHFPGHAKDSARIAGAVLHRLKAPTALREQVVFLIDHHMTPMEPDKRLLRRRLGRYGVDTFRMLLTLQKADMGSKGTGITTGMDQFPLLRRLVDEILDEDACLTVKDLPVDGRDLMALGFAPGPKIGACLNSLLSLVQDEALPNDRDALLSKAKEYLSEGSV